MKEKKLTKLQQRAVKALADPEVLTVTDASKKSGMSRKQIYRMSQNDTFLAELENEKAKLLARMTERGYTAEKAAEKIVEGLEALTTGKFCGQTDHNTRFKYLELFLKLKGIIKDSTGIKNDNRRLTIYDFKDTKTEDLVRSIDEQIAAFNPEELKGLKELEGFR